MDKSRNRRISQQGDQHERIFETEVFDTNDLGTNSESREDE